MTLIDEDPLQGKSTTSFVQPASDPGNGFESELFTISLPVLTGQVDIVVMIRAKDSNVLELLIFIISLRALLSKFESK